MTNPRLRGGALQPRGPYPLGRITDGILINIGKQLVHRASIGLTDISGDDFGAIFARAVGGEHRNSPLGLADVLWGKCGWSVKTVKSNNPFAQTKVRLISGRNSPDYSLGIQNVHDDPFRTGEAVLSVWNARLNEAKTLCDDLRVVVLLRNAAAGKFTIFEEEPVRFSPDDFQWAFNRNNNLEGREIASGAHRFTWQPHGSQFTIFRDVPGSARGFSIPPNVPTVPPDAVLRAIGFNPSWIAMHPGARQLRNAIPE